LAFSRRFYRVGDPPDALVDRAEIMRVERASPECFEGGNDQIAGADEHGSIPTIFSQIHRLVFIQTALLTLTNRAAGRQSTEWVTDLGHPGLVRCVAQWLAAFDRWQFA
jgi:hypothetical protein